MSRDFRHDPEAEPNMRTSSPVSELVDVFERFDMVPGGFLGERGRMEQDPTGDWVRYSDAVNTISAQKAVVACKNAALTTLSTRNAELEREVKRLREALEMISHMHDSNPPLPLADMPELDYARRTISTMRREARAALSTSPQGGDHE